MILIIKQLNNMTLIIKHLKTRFMIHKYGFYCFVFLMFLDREMFGVLHDKHQHT